jgi:hypothetical protein
VSRNNLHLFRQTYPPFGRTNPLFVASWLFERPRAAILMFGMPTVGVAITRIRLARNYRSTE